MNVDNVEFYVYLALASIFASLAAQVKGLNGRRPRWLRIVCETFFYSVAGFAAGLLISRQISDRVAAIGAVMAICLLRMSSEQIFTGGMLGKIGVRRDKNKK